MLVHRMQDQPKSFLEHLEDLRMTVLKCLAALTITTCVSIFYTSELLAVLEWPLKKSLEGTGKNVEDFLIMQNMMEPLTITIQTSISAGIIFASPFMLYFIGQFLLPALNPKERRMILPAFTFGIFMFLAGVCFCYFLLLPQAVGFFIEWGTSLRRQFLMPQDMYLGFILQMLFAFGLSFELPLLIMILAKMGIVNTQLLTTYRRHAFVFIIIFAACVTPTTDPFSLAMLTIPMYLLYEMSILGAWWIQRKQPQTPGDLDDLGEE